MTQLAIKAGKNSTVKLVYRDADGIIIDLTGATARLVARQGFYTDVLLEKAAVIDGANGEIKFNFIPSDTANILENEQEKRILKCDVELTKANGDIVDLFEECFLKVSQSIAR